jgi:hypothetical protein
MATYDLNLIRNNAYVRIAFPPLPPLPPVVSTIFTTHRMDEASLRAQIDNYLQGLGAYTLTYDALCYKLLPRLLAHFEANDNGYRRHIQAVRDDTVMQNIQIRLLMRARMDLLRAKDVAMTTLQTQLFAADTPAWDLQTPALRHALTDCLICSLQLRLV